MGERDSQRLDRSAQLIDSEHDFGPTTSGSEMIDVGRNIFIAPRENHEQP